MIIIRKGEQFWIKGEKKIKDYQLLEYNNYLKHRKIWKPTFLFLKKNQTFFYQKYKIIKLFKKIYIIS